MNPGVDGYTKTLNHQQILRKTQKILKTKRILKLKYKASGSPSFTFTVACKRGQFAPPAAAGRPKHRKNFHWLFARSGKILEIPSFDKKFSGVPSKNISLTAKFYWNSINSSWILAVSTPVVSSCRSSAPPLSSVNAMNDASLSTNIIEDAQQSSGTYKNFYFIFGAHMCMCLFASVENSVMSVTKKGFEERAATVFEKKVAKLFENVGNQLFNKLNISGIFLLLFSPIASEND